MGLLLHADLLKEHLESVTALEGLAVHVDRKFDIREAATAALSKSTVGAFLSISFGGWTPLNDEASREYWAAHRFELSLATMPHLLEEQEMPSFDELLRLIVIAIQGLKPSEINPAYCSNERWSVGAGNYVPDDDFLVYLFTASIDEDFFNPITRPAA